MSQISEFNFGPHDLRVVMEDGEPWFVAADVAAALGVGRTDDAVARLDNDEKGAATIRTPGGQQEMTTINESGLYSLILTSRKPEARKFKKWVTSEVLPSIRKTGSYSAPSAQAAVDPIAAFIQIGKAVGEVPGVSAGIAMAVALRAIKQATGIDTEPFRLALPAPPEPLASLNATALGDMVNLSAHATNLLLSRCGYQYRNSRGEWELTPAGRKWGEAFPYNNNGHSGYQILWKPEVAQEITQ